MLGTGSVLVERGVVRRSLVTVATTDAAAIEALTRSPFHTARAGAGRPRMGKPSVRT